MTTYTVELTETETKAMEWLTDPVQDWIDNAAHNKARIATDDIVDIYTKRALDEGVQIPITRDEIVADAFTREWVKLAKQRNEEAEAAKPE